MSAARKLVPLLEHEPARTGLSLVEASRLNWTRPPLCGPEFGMGVLDTTYSGWAEKHAPAIATLVGLAIDLEVVDPEPALSALESWRGLDIYRETHRAADRIGAWMHTRMVSAAGGDPGYAPFLSLTITDSNPGFAQIVLWARSAWDFLFDIKRLDPALQPLAAQAFHIASYFTEAMIGEDVLHYATWIDMLTEEVRELKDKGLLDDPDDLTEAYKACMEGQFDMLYGFDYPEFCERVSEVALWLDSLHAPGRPVTRGNVARECRWVLSQLSVLSEESKEIAQHPFTEVLREIALAGRRYHREQLRQEPLARGTYEEGEQPLGTAHAILLGNGYEETAINEVRNYLNETGEEPAISFEVDSVASSALRVRLDSIATMIGLLTKAENLFNDHFCNQ